MIWRARYRHIRVPKANSQCNTLKILCLLFCTLCYSRSCDSYLERGEGWANAYLKNQNENHPLPEDVCPCIRTVHSREKILGFAQVREEHNTALVSHIPRIHVHRTITYVTSDDLRLAYVRTRSGSRTVSRGGEFYRWIVHAANTFV